MIPDESSVHAVLAVNETFVVYVDPGESLSQLAARHGVTLEQLQQWNGIENPDYVQAGQRIVVHEAAVPPGPDGEAVVWGAWMGGAIFLVILVLLYRRKRGANTRTARTRNALSNGTSNRYRPKTAPDSQAARAPKTKSSDRKDQVAQAWTLHTRNALRSGPLYRSGPKPAPGLWASPAPKANAGERKVKSVLSRSYPEWPLLNEVLLRSGGGTAQIDHILVSPSGVFVIETKDMSGWVFGSPGQRRWTQTFMAGRQSRRVGIKSKRYTFYNPLRQNEGHAKALVELGVVDPWQIRPVAVFVGGAELKTAEKFVPIDEHEKIARRSRTWRMRGVVCMSLAECHRYIAFSIRAASSPRLTRERMEAIRAEIAGAAVPATAESHARHVEFARSAKEASQ